MKGERYEMGIRQHALEGQAGVNVHVYDRALCDDHVGVSFQEIVNADGRVRVTDLRLTEAEARLLAHYLVMAAEQDIY